MTLQFLNIDSFREILESVANGMLIADSSGNIIWCNHAVTDLTGYSLEELSGKHTRIFKSGFQNKSYYTELWNAVVAKKVWKGELINRRKNGTFYFERMTITPIDVQSQTYFIAIKEDCTVEKHQREEIKQSALKYKSIINSMHSAFVLFEVINDSTGKTVDFRYVEVNPAFEKMLNVKKEKVLNKKVSSIYPLEFLNQLQRIYSYENFSSFEQKDFNTDRYFDAVTYKIGDNYFALIFQDITHHKELINSETRYKTIVQDQTDLICRFTADYNITFTNNAFCVFFDIKNTSSLDIRNFRKMSSLNTDREYNTVTEKIMLKEQSRWIRWKDRKITDTEYQSVGTDITDIQNAEIELKKTMRNLKSYNDYLKSFTYIASHDLKDPIRKSQIFMDRLSVEIPDVKNNVNFQNTRSYLSKAERLIKDLFTFVHTSNSKVYNEKVDLEMCLNDISYSLAERLERENVKIIRKIKLPKVFCDATMITQVFYNLISNAIKYNDKKDKIVEITCFKNRNKETVFGVRDNGIGIKKENKKYIFEAFKRLHSEEEIPGSGIGLTICKKVVEKHGGKMWVDSEYGIGSHFKFTIAPEGKSN